MENFWYFLLVSLICVLAGFLLLLKPVLTIEIQKKFYEKINWRIEPISMEKEIRNTRIMGLFLIIVSLLVTGYVLITGV